MSSEGEAAISNHQSAKGDDHDSENNHYDLDEMQGIKQTNFIPIDIVAGVLLRLPAKSIGRLRCVCRQWRSLTHDARFVDQHRSLGGASTSPMLVATDLIRTNTTIERISVFNVGPNRDEFKHRFVNIKFDEPSCTDLYSFSNPANGLISVIGITKPDIFLLNPTTREISRLPLRCDMVKRCFRRFGLGFDASRGAYKMVTFGSSSCVVLTVGGTGGWRYIGDAPCRVFSRPFSLYGTIYWLADAGVYLGVLAFDVRHETMQFIPAPNILTSAHRSAGSMPLHDLGGHLCICIVEASQFLRIWVLTDNHEWKPQYDVHISLLLNQTETIQVIAILDGQVLIRTLDDAVYSYDLHRKTLHWICPVISCVNRVLSRISRMNWVLSLKASSLPEI